MKNQIEFLGIQIDKNGIKMQTHIVQKIINSNEQLDTKKKLQSFLGLVNQVREYISKLAENLKPLQQKIKKDVEYQFDKKDQTEIQKIKLLCKNLPKLYFLDENKKITYIVESDASEKSYGGVLKYTQKLDEIIIAKRQELKHRQNRLNNNIFAGICYKSIIAQRMTILYLKIQINNLEYKLQHNL